MQRLDMATKGVDFIINTAATKIVPTAEDNPFECIKTYTLWINDVVNCEFQIIFQKTCCLV